MTLPVDSEGKEIPLKLNFNTEDLTVSEIGLFEPGGYSSKGFVAFMDAHSNYTAVQAGKLTIKELRVISERITDRLMSDSVPNENGEPSKPGPG